jgi:hypothetical protein
MVRRARRFRVTTLVVTLAAVMAGVLTGCGDDDDDGSSASSTSASTPTATTVPAGPITVEQLVARSADTPVATQGFLHVVGDVARLCGAILESYPPQCGQPAVELVGLDLEAVDGLTSAEGVNWKESIVLTLERSADGRFTVVAVGADG